MKIVSGEFDGEVFDDVLSNRLHIRELGDHGLFLARGLSNETEDRLQMLPLRHNIGSVDVVGETSAKGGGLTGAAGGAVLGFLVAGPVGTLLGAAAGSSETGVDSKFIAVTFLSGEQLVLCDVAPSDIGKLVACKNETDQFLALSIREQIKQMGLPRRIKSREQSSVSLPDLDFIVQLQSQQDNCDPVAASVISRILSCLDEYNTFKWRYFDLLINSRYEFQALVEYALRSVIHATKDIPLTQKRAELLKQEILAIAREQERLNDELEQTSTEMRSAGMFKRGGFKKHMVFIDNQLKRCSEGIQWRETVIKDLESRFSLAAVDINEHGAMLRALAKDYLDDEVRVENCFESLDEPPHKVKKEGRGEVKEDPLFYPRAMPESIDMMQAFLDESGYVADLSAEEELRCVHSAQSGNGAVSKSLIDAVNSWDLLYSLVLKKRHKDISCWLEWQFDADIEMLIAFSGLELMSLAEATARRALDTFDTAKTIRFSTYALWHMGKAIEFFDFCGGEDYWESVQYALAAEAQSEESEGAWIDPRAKDYCFTIYKNHLLDQADHAQDQETTNDLPCAAIDAPMQQAEKLEPSTKDRLISLKDLLESDLISKDEYEQKKATILSEM
ncbi:SHOCT domain-containing protein [Pseudomonadales bacterium]|nr:SHOCT domain-containing protein [Pseudomonadales bacterium]